ncbi:phosphoribosyl-ATP diphosphatase [Patescibacteria group bacterium]|nr:phosphoribosyl-ATP diphosphatase [Patescibacteria group bacterium]
MRLLDLYSIIRKRIKEKPEESKVAGIFSQGEDRMLQKIGEEAVELVIAGKGHDRQRVIEETADLYFMSLIFLAAKGITVLDIYKELTRRVAGKKEIHLKNFSRRK